MSADELATRRMKRADIERRAEELREMVQNMGRVMIYLVELVPDREIRLPAGEAVRPQPGKRIDYRVDGDELVVTVADAT